MGSYKFVYYGPVCSPVDSNLTGANFTLTQTVVPMIIFVSKLRIQRLHYLTAGLVLSFESICDSWVLRN